MARPPLRWSVLLLAPWLGACTAPGGPPMEEQAHAPASKRDDPRTDPAEARPAAEPSHAWVEPGPRLALPEAYHRFVR